MTEPLSLDRFQRLLAAYGARRELWPAAEREAAELLLERSSEARALAAKEDGLDSELAALSALEPELSPGLSRRLAEIPLRQTRKRALWPFGRVWIPAVAWAAAAVFGLAVGNFAPNDDASDVTVAVDAAQPDSDEGDATDATALDDDMTELALGSLDEFEETP